MIGVALVPAKLATGNCHSLWSGKWGSPWTLVGTRHGILDGWTAPGDYWSEWGACSLRRRVAGSLCFSRRSPTGMLLSASGRRPRTCWKEVGDDRTGSTLYNSSAPRRRFSKGYRDCFTSFLWEIDRHRPQSSLPLVWVDDERPCDLSVLQVATSDFQYVNKECR